MRSVPWLCLAMILCVGSVHGDVLSYCAKSDPSYTWDMVEERDLEDGSQIVDLGLTSQTWMGIAWKHTVRVIIPKGADNARYCGLYITGGNPGEEELAYFKMVSKTTQWPMAAVYNIPNQPLYEGLKEDALISYTFVQFMETGDEDWPLLFPMTKSVVKAMDALQEYMLKERKQEIDGFLTFGASKRGWTTWFSSVVDGRVKAAAPIVYDNLNLELQMPHQLVAFGGYSEQINDYSEKGLPDMLGSEKGKIVAELVDPFTYRHRTTCPKLMIIGTNDRYWPLDALNLYYDDLYGRNYILYVPNNGHGLKDLGRVLSGIAGLAKMTDGSLPFPELESDCVLKDDKVVFTASASPVPSSMRLWTAEASSRDFRESEWVFEEISPSQEGEYGFEVEASSGKYGALFGEYVYKLGERTLMLSTNLYMAGPDPDSGKVVLLSRP